MVKPYRIDQLVSTYIARANPLEGAIFTDYVCEVFMNDLVRDSYKSDDFHKQARDQKIQAKVGLHPADRFWRLVRTLVPHPI